MSNKFLLASLVAATLSANADVTIGGNYEGTFTDGSGATYAQDLDLTIVGSTAGAKVTVMMEDLTGGSTLSANQVFVETNIEGLELKAGTYKGQNGIGILQKQSAASNQFEIAVDTGFAGMGVAQQSGNGKATIDVDTTIAGFGHVSIQNVTATDRFVSVITEFFGIGVNAETQNTSVGRNTAVTANALIGTETAFFEVTGAIVDVNDATAVTQDDGLLGDISDAVNGKTVTGLVVATNTLYGTVTGKLIDKNDKNTYVAEVEKGVLTLGYAKTEDTDGVATAEINIAF
jgi:hypothetical protein